MDTADDELITTEEASAILTVKINTMERWRHFGIGPEFVKLGDTPQSPVRYFRRKVIEYRDRRIFRSTSAYSANAKLQNPSPSDAAA